MDRVEGGFIVKARVVQRSWISKAPPHIREIWDWILMNANYKDNGKVKRGQLLTTYGEIMEGLAWYVGYRKETYKKHHCETATKALTRQLMITTTRTTRGVIITVLNYDKYQDVKNYESDNETCYETTRDVRESGYDKETKNQEERKKKKDIAIFDPISVRPVFISEKSWADVVEHRRKKRAASTERAYVVLIKEFQKAVSLGFSIEKCIDKMTQRNWTGFEAEWMVNDEKKGKGSSRNQIVDEKAERARYLLGIGGTNDEEGHRGMGLSVGPDDAGTEIKRTAIGHNSGLH